MKHTGKCPKCAEALSSIKFEVVDVAEHGQNIASAGVYLCPACNTILGVGLHPEVFVSDIVARLGSAMRKP
jgi:uncharacterized protein with PIN domain